MFDPKIVRHDMERIFARPPRAGTLEEPSNVRVIAIGEDASPAKPPAPERRGGLRRAIVLVCVALLVLPALAFGARYAIDSFKHSTPPSQAPALISVRSASTTKTPPAPILKPPPKNPAAFMVVMEKPLPQRPYRARRRWPSARYPTPLQAERDADATTTKQLNRASLESMQPTLRYAPGITDQRPPR